MTSEQKDLLKSLFEVVVKYVLSDGGDGSGDIICKNPWINYREVSAFFESLYLVENTPLNGWFKDDFGFYVLFSDKHNEGIAIMDGSDERSEKFGLDTIRILI